eukprot:3272566-Prymnesium_polylepis.1
MPSHPKAELVVAAECLDQLPRARRARGVHQTAVFLSTRLAGNNPGATQLVDQVIHHSLYIIINFLSLVRGHRTSREDEFLDGTVHRAEEVELPNVLANCVKGG